MARPNEAGGTDQGWNWSVYLHPDDRDRTHTSWSNAIASGEPYSIEYRLRRVDGEYRWFIGRALPQRDASGAILRWFGTSTDIDDQKRAEVEREALLASERVARRQIHP